ncbi:hypothetical protein OK016_28040 [Vibrio chagasii]|nr:hypothetical protein [Vibrio chagasii]
MLDQCSKQEQTVRSRDGTKRAGSMAMKGAITAQTPCQRSKCVVIARALVHNPSWRLPMSRPPA